MISSAITTDPLALYPYTFGMWQHTRVVPAQDADFNNANLRCYLLFAAFICVGTPNKPICHSCTEHPGYSIVPHSACGINFN